MVLAMNREEAIRNLNVVFDEEKKQRAREAWFNGALWVLLKLPSQEAEAIADELLDIMPDKERKVRELIELNLI